MDFFNPKAKELLTEIFFYEKVWQFSDNCFFKNSSFVQMLSGFVALAHVFEYNLIGNAVAHGTLTIPIIKGFIISLTQCSIAHPAAASIIVAGSLIVVKFKSIVKYVKKCFY